MRTTLAIAALILAACVSSVSADSPRADLVIASGTSGRLASVGDSGRRRAPWIEVATSPETFIEEWNRYVPGDPAEAIKGTDFAHDLVVFLLLGPQQTGGYAIEPIDVKVEGTIIKVRAKLVQPMTPEDSVTQAITAPYGVVRAPAIPFERIEWIDSDGRILATRTTE